MSDVFSASIPAPWPVLLAIFLYILMSLPTLRAGIILVALLYPSFQSNAAQTQVDQNIQLIEKRIEVKKNTALIRGDWTVKKEELKAESTILSSEIESLQKKLDALITINDDLIAREQTAADSTEGQERVIVLLKERSAQYEQLLLDLALRLPPPLATQVQEELGVVAIRDSKNIGARFQAIVTSLNLIHRFNQKPYYTKEAYQPDSGSAKQLDVLYWGIGIGYRIDPTDSIAQIGSPGENGWMWFDASAHMQNIRQVFNIHEAEETPTYVQLPLQSSDD